MTFQYNEQQAMAGGASSYVSQTGAYKGKITHAEWRVNQNGFHSLMLSFLSDDGERADYLQMHYRDGEGNTLDYGNLMIQAVMGCTGVKSLSEQIEGDAVLCPELVDKRIGLFLQKVWYTKQDGSDGYSFQILIPFSPVSMKTLEEHLKGKDAARVAHLSATVKDKDNRGKQRGRVRGAKPYKQAVANNNTFEEAFYTDTPF